MNNQGYIYIYKCLIGKCSDICKIGVTGDYKSRLEQHVRTPYFGFMPYCDFSTGKPIATVFKVNDYTNCDSIIKKHFKHLQVSSLEIYNVEYDKAIKEIYDLLVFSKQYIELIPDGISLYDYIPQYKQDAVFDDDTSKKTFTEIIDKISNKYNNNYPEEFINMLRDKADYEENCKSHYNTGNYIVISDKYILDLNYSKAKRTELKEKLLNILNKN